MPDSICKVLLIEDNPVNAKLIKNLLLQSNHSSLAKGLSFDFTWAKTISEGRELLIDKQFDVILVDLMLPDSSGIDSLIGIREQVPHTPIIVQTGSEDENLVVKSFQLGADGYLKKNNLDRNLLIYAIRLAMERRRYFAKWEQHQLAQQELEFKNLEQLAYTPKTTVTARMFGSQSLREGVPDIFAELVNEYGNLMDLALEERAYRVEHNIGESLRSLAEKLGFLKASPRDVIDLHTRALKQKNENVTLAKAQAYVAEGRLMVLELMGYLTSYYRKYYIGLIDTPPHK